MATTPTPIYISASRRCDLPRFGADRFFAAVKRGQVTYNGGYGRTYTVSLNPDDVLGYIFWSKDYSQFIDHPDLPGLLNRNNAIFHYTINDNPDLEPNIPPVKDRIDSLAALCRLAGPERVLWRYDPVCKYADQTGQIVMNDQPFRRLVGQIAELGVTHCFFSFMTNYNKLQRRPVRFVPFTDAEKSAVAASMAEAAGATGMTLYNCCNPEILTMAPSIRMAHCVDDELLASTDRFGVHRLLKPAPTRIGCGCSASRDIGAYKPACDHGCFYCYANPAMSLEEASRRSVGLF
jgi:hypothetical protein